MEKINVFKGMFDSWVFMMVILSTIIFQILLVELLGEFADTVPLSWELWLASVLIGAISLVISVLVKCIPVPPAKNTGSERRSDGYERLPSGPDLA